MPRLRQVTIGTTGPEWDPLFAYAESQGLTPAQAARELLMTALATTAQDAVYLATAKIARHKMTQIAFSAAAHAMRNAWEEMKAQAIAAGVNMEGD